MEIVTNYKDIKPSSHPIALTIGSFDGLHLGHQKIFHKLRELTGNKGAKVVISFSNHPVEILKPNLSITKITSVEEKLELFKEMGINIAILLEFTPALQALSYEDFIQDIRTSIPFKYLVLGQGASFGKNQEGNESRIKALGNRVGFEAFYLEKVLYNDIPISSKLIRDHLQLGDVEYTKHLLGRPYSFYAPFHLEKLQETGQNRLKITFDFQNHCLIPSGHYVVNLRAGDHETLAIAYLTTLVSDKTSKTFDLEIFIKGPKTPFMNDNVKVEFIRKIPSSKSFDEIIESSDKIRPINL
jgi:riboflavin kinase / FMN adenylyltransferase